MSEIVAKIHASDCALHNAPALEPGLCDCGADPEKEVEKITVTKAPDTNYTKLCRIEELLRRLVNQLEEPLE